MFKKLVRHSQTANPFCEEYKAWFFEGISHSRAQDVVQSYPLNPLAARQSYKSKNGG